MAQLQGLRLKLFISGCCQLGRFTSRSVLTSSFAYIKEQVYKVCIYFCYIRYAAFHTWPILSSARETQVLNWVAGGVRRLRLHVSCPITRDQSRISTGVILRPLPSTGKQWYAPERSDGPRNNEPERVGMSKHTWQASLVSN